MSVRNLFPTLLYEARCNDAALIDRLAHMARTLAQDDRAGRMWSKSNGYRGYTSYASLDDLPRRDPDVAALVRILDRHVAAFAKSCAFDLHGKLRLDSLWVNILKPGGTHSGHIHPHSAVSGTIYVDVPDGAGGIRFEDPRLPLMMAAPLRLPDAPEDQRSFVTVAPSSG
nr:TIGR02466 family protein [Sphingopyxis sp.]